MVVRVAADTGVAEACTLVGAAVPEAADTVAEVDTAQVVVAADIEAVEDTVEETGAGTGAAEDTGEPLAVPGRAVVRSTPVLVSFLAVHK